MKLQLGRSVKLLHVHHTSTQRRLNPLHVFFARAFQVKSSNADSSPVIFCRLLRIGLGERPSTLP
jgi:hypothetical protein